ncbi:MAG: hypothetical protein U5K51_12990 [Flavobacteriaceae bacterium]|nr:hypothetical protein [Flavobacteriaceae bacterium]
MVSLQHWQQDFVARQLNRLKPTNEKNGSTITDVAVAQRSIF